MNILNTPIELKRLQLNNRLVMPPMATSKSGKDGQVTGKLCDYYDEKSKGGYIGLIITEHSFVSPEGKANTGQLSIANDRDIDGLKQLTAVIHNNNTKAFAQINHAGGAAKAEVTGQAALGASAMPLPKAAPDAPKPKAMDLADIQKAVFDFTRAAVRAKEAGFDGVEIHSAHGYLLNQFFSPLTNNRTDAFQGSSIDGRIKLHLDIIQSIRNAVGSDYPIALRLGACDYMANGTTIEDSVAAARAFENAGVDLLDISGGFCMYTKPGAKEEGYFSDLSQAIKNAVNLPVILTGGIVSAAAAEALLETEKADLIGVGRAILKDSNWAKNALQSLAR